MSIGYPPPSGYDVGVPLGYARIEDHARTLRQQLFPQARPEDGVSARHLFNRLDEYRVQAAGGWVPLDYAVAPFPEGREGMTVFSRAENRIVVALSERTSQGMNAGDGRCAFTLFHEVGHAVLHPDLVIRLVQMPHRQAALMREGGPKHPHYRDSEWQANAFAAALAVPATALDSLERSGRLTPDVVVARFGVSERFAQVRIDVFRKRRSELLGAGSS